jgi:hypothetical protein
VTSKSNPSEQLFIVSVNRVHPQTVFLRAICDLA